MTIDGQNLLAIAAVVSGLGGIITAVATRRKTKADALGIIQTAAANQVLRMEEEATKWKEECHLLRDELEELKGKVDEQDACQTTLQHQILTLQDEKKELQARVAELSHRITELEQENKKLRCEVDKAEV